MNRRCSWVDVGGNFPAWRGRFGLNPWSGLPRRLSKRQSGGGGFSFRRKVSASARLSLLHLYKPEPKDATKLIEYSLPLCKLLPNISRKEVGF